MEIKAFHTEVWGKGVSHAWRTSLLWKMVLKKLKPVGYFSLNYLLLFYALI